MAKEAIELALEVRQERGEEIPEGAAAKLHLSGFTVDAVVTTHHRRHFLWVEEQDVWREHEDVEAIGGRAGPAFAEGAVVAESSGDAWLLVGMFTFRDKLTLAPYPPNYRTCSGAVEEGLLEEGVAGARTRHPVCIHGEEVTLDEFVQPDPLLGLFDPPTGVFLRVGHFNH